MYSDFSSNTLVMLPAYNEEASIGSLVREIRAEIPGFDILVINDGSSDQTTEVAREAGAVVLDLPCNLGVGGAVQAGFRYAYERGYAYAVRCDADGQHPPSEIPHLLDGMRQHPVDLVIGSRFLGDRSYTSSPLRHVAIVILAWLLSAICRKRVTDPTSGFQMLSRVLLRFFASSYPADYPEPEALALLRRQGYDFAEVATRFRERKTGQSSIRGWGTLYHVVKVFLALLVDRARTVDPRLSRANLLGQI